MGKTPAPRAPFWSELVTAVDLPSIRLRGLPARPDLVIRLIQVGLATHENLVLCRRARTELAEQFQVAMPKFTYVRGEGPPAVYEEVDFEAVTGGFVVTRRVEGVPLLEAISSSDPEESNGCRQLYDNLIRYCHAKHVQGGTYLVDFHNRQFLHGSTVDDPTMKPYLIDLDPIVMHFSPTNPSLRNLISFYGRFADVANMITEASTMTAIDLTKTRSLVLETLARMETEQITDARYPDLIRYAFTRRQECDWHEWLDPIA